jgi:hypothetical protein
MPNPQLWSPPEEDTIESKSSTWEPPTDDVILEPVKKKDESALNSTSSPESETDGELSKESSQKITPISPENAKIFERLGKEAKGEKETPQLFDLEKEKVNFKKAEAERKDFQENKIQNPLKSAGKSAWGVLRYDIPASTLALTAAQKSEFSGGQFSTLGTQVKAAQAGKDPMEETKNQALREQLELITKSLDIQKAGAEDRKYLVNTLKKVQDPIDAVNWLASAIGQAAGQIPLTLATGGATSFTQEVGSIYLDGIEKIKAETGKSFEQIIKDGDDESLAPLLFGLTAAGLDRLGAGKVAKSFTQKDVLNAYRSRAGVVYGTAQTEGVTETGQTTLESLGVSKMAGKTWAQSIMEVDSDALVESYFQGVAGGGAGAGVGQTFQAVTTKKIPDVVKKVDVNNPISIQKAVDEVEQIINNPNGNTGTTTPTDVSTEPTPGDNGNVNTTPSSDNGGLPDGTNISTDDTSLGAGNAGDVTSSGDQQGNATPPLQKENQPNQEGEQNIEEKTEPATGEPTESTDAQLSPLDTAKKTAREKIEGLVASGDVSFEDGKVTILTEKGGQEISVIKKELDNAKQESEATKQQPSSGEEATSTTTNESQLGGLPATDTEASGKPAETGDQVTTDTTESPVEETQGGSEKLPAKGQTITLDIEDRKKSLLNRAYEGATDNTVKESIKKHGLDYDIESFEEAKQKADKVIAEVGLDGALAAVRNGDIDGAPAARIFAQAIDYTNRQMQASKDQAEVQKFADIQADLLSQFDNRARKGGQFNSFLQDVYLTSDFHYNIERQIEQYKAVNNGKISAEVEARLRGLDQQMKEANAKISQLESERSAREEKDAMEALKRDAEAEKKKRGKLVTNQKKKEIISFFDSLKVKDVGGTANDVVRVLGSAIWNGSLDVVKTAIISGANVANAVQAGLDYIKQNYAGTEFNKEEYRQIIQPGVEKMVPKEPTPKKEKVEKTPAQPSIKEDGSLSIPNGIIRAIVEGGANTIQEVVDKILPVVQEVLPDVTERQVRDAVTRYGKTRGLSKDEISTKVREIKQVGRLVSALEDVEEGKRPMRSGLQRDKPSDEVRRRQREIKEKMKDIPLSEEETAQNWKTALDAVKARLENNIKDIQHQIDKKEKNPPKKGIEYDQEANDLKRRRDGLREELNNLVGKPEMSDEQKVKAVIKRLKDQTQKIEDKVNSKKISYDSAKKPLPETAELREARRRLKEARETLDQMRKEAGLAEKRQLEIYKKAIRKAISQYEERITNKDFQAKPKKEKTFDDEMKKLMTERENIKERFQIEQEKNRLANRSFGEKLKDTLVDVANLPKSLISSIDLSAPFRQGAVLSAGNPRAAAKSFAEMLHQAVSKSHAEKWLGAVKQSDAYSVMKAAGLYLAEPHVKMAAREEAFLSNIAERIPGYGRLVSGSQRAYTGYLNKLRVDVFNAGAQNMKDQGITPENNPEAYKAWATFINNATGRGEFNSKTLENATPLLNAFMFSPRYLASRVNLLNPLTYAKMPAPVRRMALKNIISYVGLGSMVLAMAAAGGAEVEEDPRSSDFGKIKIGNTRYDIWAGFLPIIRFIVQMATAQRKSTSTGKIQELDGSSWNKETRADLVANFIRSKASPALGSTWNLAEGENMVGEKTSIYDEAVRLVVPLYIQDMADISSKEGPTMLLQTAIPAVFGIGVQNYQSGKKKKQSEKKAPVKAWVDKKVKAVKASLE